MTDFETEVSMNGIINFLGNSTGVYANETVSALEVINYPEASSALKAIIQEGEKAGMTHDSIQIDRAPLKEYAVSSFSEIHGKKWDDACDKIFETEESINYDTLYEKMEIYLSVHKTVVSEFLDIKA